MGTKDNAIIIKDFQAGVNENNQLGFQSMVECDIDSNTGSLAMNRLLAQKSTNGVFTGGVVSISSDGDYALDEDGKISESPFTSALTGVPHNYSNNIEVWKDYLFHIGNSGVDVMEISTGTWTTSWDGDSTSSPSFAESFPYIANNGDLYIGGDRYVYNLHEVATKTFDPTDNTTFTINEKALPLPDGYDIVSISEIGNNLVISANKDSKGAVFLWDKYSDNYYDPIKINEKISQSISYNGLVYVNTVPQCTFYVTNGSSINKLATLPMSSLYVDYLPGSYLPKNSSLSCRSNAIDIVNKKILFAPNSSFDQVAPIGVYSFDPNKNTFKCENLLSTRSDRDVDINVIHRKDSSIDPYIYIVGYGDTSGTTDVFAIDEVSTTADYADGFTGFITQFYRVGTVYEPRTFKRVELYGMAQVISTFADIKMEYRINMTEPWIEIFDVRMEDYTTGSDGGKDCIVKDFAPTAYNIQFRVSFRNVRYDFQLAEIRII